MVDLERAKEFPNAWRVRWDKNSECYYVRAHLRNSEGRKDTVMLHRWLLKVSDPAVHIDHVNHDTLDNTRENLNKVTNAENQQNRKKRPNCSSDYIGVSWNKASKKWRAYIKINGENKHLGLHGELDDAVQARKDAEAKYFEYKTMISENKAEVDE